MTEGLAGEIEQHGEEGRKCGQIDRRQGVIGGRAQQREEIFGTAFRSNQLRELRRAIE